MESTEAFKLSIQNYLVNLSKKDPLFAVTYAKKGKNIDDCVVYILNTVQKSGCNGFADEEIYAMAVHYYDENNIDIGKPINAKVVVNHTIDSDEHEEEETPKVVKQAPKSLKPCVISRKPIENNKPVIPDQAKPISKSVMPFVVSQTAVEDESSDLQLSLF